MGYHTVASSILLSSYESLRVEKTSVRAVPDLIDDIGFKIDVEGTGNMFARRSLREKCAEAAVVGRRRAFHETSIWLQ